MGFMEYTLENGMEIMDSETKHFGICRWIGQDGKTVAVQCNRRRHEKRTLSFRYESIL